MELSIKSSFVAFELTEAEQKAAYTFTHFQVAGIKNLISAAAEELVTIPLTEDFTEVPAMKRVAFLQGQIEILKYILSLNETLATGDKDQ